MKWRWKWDEKLLNQDAKRGTQEKRERANTNTTHLARNGQTLKRQGKRKRAEGRRTRTKTSGGRGGRKRLNQPDTARTYKNLSTQRAKPTWREENARTHEKGRKGDPWGPTVDGQNIQTLQHALCWTPAPPNLNVSAHVFAKVMLGVWFVSSIGANALQVTITLNFGGEGVVPDRRGLNISSIYGSSKSKWCIHNPCSIRDKAQGPRLSNQNPVYSWRVQPLNYVHNFNLTNDHQKKESPYLKHVLLPHVKWLRSVSCEKEKRPAVHFA